MKGAGRVSVDEEAVHWFVRLRDAAATADDRRGFSAWLAGDPRRRQAWSEVEALWQGLDDLPRSEFPGAEPTEATAVVPLASARRTVVPTWRALAALAAVLLLFVASGLFWAAQPPGFAAALFADHRTGIGEARTVQLPDGSSVALAPASALSVSFDGSERRVELHQGEAYFSVAADPRRRFVVEAAGGSAAVVGTAFDVRLAEDEARVSVASGLVEVSAGRAGTIRLAPGEAVRYDAEGLGPRLAVEPADVGLWRQHRLVFQATPLGEVLRDLERYRRGRILVLDERIAALPVTGVFDTRRPEAALETIERTLPVELTRITGLLTLLQAKE